jgi:hypothetical protein
MDIGKLFSVVGLGLDIVGASFLAYDLIMKPGALFQAEVARKRLDGIKDWHNNTSFIYDPEQHPPEERKKANQVRVKELNKIDRAKMQNIQKLKHYENHDDRSSKYAIIGLLLLVAGFCLQAIGVLNT